jgi:hypothetical protein
MSTQRGFLLLQAPSLVTIRVLDAKRGSMASALFPMVARSSGDFTAKQTALIIPHNVLASADKVIK